MKTSVLLIIFMSIFYVYESTICDDGSECPGDNATCCRGLDKFLCCVLENAVCCGDGYHCCPKGTFCNKEEKKCDTISADFMIIKREEVREMTPTSLIYKRGWNALYENCRHDLKLLTHDFVELLRSIFEGNYHSVESAKEMFIKLIEEGQITNTDCIKFLKEVFG